MLCLVGGSHQEPNDHRLLHINDVKFDHMDLVVATRFFFCKDIFSFEINQWDDTWRVCFPTNFQPFI